MKKVKDVMTKECEWIAPETTLMDAAKIMEEKDCGFLPVGENDKLIGMVTDRDITIRAVAKGKDAKLTTVREIMTEKTYYCYDDDKIEDACRAMGDLKVKRFPVVDSKKRLVGIVSFGDVSQAADSKSVGESQQLITEETAQKKAA